jgi:hypothetical protein
MTIVELDEIEAEQIARQAQERGYESVLDYLRALVAADALVGALRDDWQEAEDSADVLEAEFREAWHDALTGNTLPVETLWDTMDDDG